MRELLLVLLSVAIFVCMVAATFTAPFPVNIVLPFAFMLATYLLVRMVTQNRRSA